MTSQEDDNWGVAVDHEEVVNADTSCCGKPIDECRCSACPDCDMFGSNCECDQCRCGRFPMDCECPRCVLCRKRDHDCDCNLCDHCSLRPRDCTCGRCRICDKKNPECECPDCEICNRKPSYCFCDRNIDKRVRLPDNKFFHKVIVSASTQPLNDGTTLLLKGSLEKSRIFVVPKVSTVTAYAWRSINVNCTKLGSKTATILTKTKLYETAVSLHNKVVLKFETEMEDTHINVTSRKGVRNMVTNLAKLPRDTKTLALSFDCEALNLGRDGTTCYIQIRDNIAGDVYLVDLLTLGQTAWTTAGHDRVTTLKHIFEDRQVIKLIFDVRGDSDALHAHYGIQLAGVLDVQLLKALTAGWGTTRRTRYDITMANSKRLSSSQREEFAKYKNFPCSRDGQRDFGRFLERPLLPALKLYAINDVMFIHIMAVELLDKLNARGYELALEWTKTDIEWTWEDDYYTAHYWDDEDDHHLRFLLPAGFSTCWEEQIYNADRR